MKINELKPRMGNVEAEVEVVSVGEVREFDKYGKQGRVATAVVKDDTGEMDMSLWNEQIDKVKPGSKVKISNGYISEWQGKSQLTTGKFGTMTVSKK
ncbi:MAG: DNA-binding protein [Candidatus Altiarchaeota archaeon]|nr:DNA-binding protein [Candidatus Altiarchaeota archaeon]